MPNASLTIDGTEVIKKESGVITANHFAGHILQVQYTQFKGTARMTGMVKRTHYPICDGVAGSGTEILNVSITPRFTNSVIWLQVGWCGEFEDYNVVHDSMFGIIRDSTAIGIPDTGGGLGSVNFMAHGVTPPALSFYGDDATDTLESAKYQYFDQPNTLSAVTYKVSIHYSRNISATGLYTNRNVAGNAATGSYDLENKERGISSIVAMEIKQ